MGLGLGLLLAGCTPPIDARPALWRVSDGDTSVWLLGTIHVLPPEVRWQTPAVRAAIDAADTLVTEIPTTSDADANAAFVAAAGGHGLPPLLDRVAPATRAALTQAVAKAGLTLPALDTMKTWAAAISIGAGATRGHATRGAGLEATLGAAFAGKHRLAFDSLADQFAGFDALPETAQRQLLDRAIDGAVRGGDDYAATLQAWRTGDERTLIARFSPELAGAPALAEALMARPNRRWAGWIAHRMRTRGRVLVAVGAGHLVGPGSVVAQLRARGLRVERVE